MGRAHGTLGREVGGNVERAKVSKDWWFSFKRRNGFLKGNGGLISLGVIFFVAIQGDMTNSYAFLFLS